MKKKLYAILMTVVFTFSACTASLTLTAAPVCAASLLSYTVSMVPSGSGQLYWNYGKNLDFFITDSKGFNQKCLITKGTDYKFSALTVRGFVAEPSEGWYFDGVYDKAGRKLSLNTTNIELVQLTVKGRYYYDYIPAYDNPAYSKLTEAAYKELMKTSLKALYGTRVYKVLRKAVLYEIPKKDCTYYPKFQEKKAAPFPGKLALTKKLDSPAFYAAGREGFAAKYSSSNSKIVKVDKTSGLCRITGPGTASVTVKIAATDKTLSASYKVKVTVSPEAVTGVSASRASDRKSVTVKWKGDSRYSGYEIQLSDTKTFGKITAKKTAVSGKTSSTKVSLSKSAACSYVRVRPYKTSGGEKLYGPYVSAAVK